MYLLQYLLSSFAVLLLVYAGFLFSIKSKWIQIAKLPLAVSLITSKKSKAKFLSLTAFFTVIGGNLGVGNISGTAIALKNGGPAFILWMAIIITITTIIKYVTCYFSMEYRVKIDGKYLGGPVIYLKHAFRSKHISILFLLITIVCTTVIGNLVQINSLSIPMTLINKPPIVAAIFMSALFFVIITLRLNYISNFITTIVPVMAVAYISLSIIVLCKFNYNILPSLKLIFNRFLDFQSIKAGLIGSFFLELFHIIQIGAFRGVFATDIGLGLEGIIHASIDNQGHSEDNFKIKQSLITLISPFIVLIITFLTTMVLLVTDSWKSNLESTNLCIAAFKLAIDSEIVNYIIMFIMFCFSFTTVLTWFICSKSTIEYVLRNSRYSFLWTIIFTLIMPIGAIAQVLLLWKIADIAISLMIIINTSGLLLLFSKHKKQIFNIK